MKRFWNDMNPTLRGFLIIGLIALVVVVLNLYNVLASLNAILSIAFFLAIGVVLYLLWRDRMRHDIETWSTRSKRVFYGGAALILASLATVFYPDHQPMAGWQAIALLLTIAICGFSMYRVWRDEHTYSY
jgi:amino acid transporter